MRCAPPPTPGANARHWLRAARDRAPGGDGVLTHRGLGNNARFYARTIGTGADDVWINPMPLFHTAGCGLVTLGALQTGGVHVLSASAEPGTLLELLEAERGTQMLCVPTMLLRVLDHPDVASRDFSSWRLCALGGAPVAPELVRRARERVGVRVGVGCCASRGAPSATDHPHRGPPPARR